MKQVTSLFRTWIAAIVAVLAFPAVAQTFTVGTPATTTTSVPIVSNYGYTYSQQIFTAAQLGIPAGTTLASISFQTTSTSISSWNLSKDWVVYLGNSTKSTFATTTDWVPVTALTQVFNGAVTQPVANTWWTISFSTPFVYTGGNLIVAVDENTPSYGGLLSWRGFTSGANSSITYRSDGTNPNPASPPTASSRSSIINHIQLSTPCSGTPSVGTLTAPAIACAGSNFNLAVANDELAVGYSYSWETANAATGPWASDAQTTNTGTFNIPSGSKFYRRTTTCAFSNISSTTLPLEVTSSQPLAAGGIYTVGGSGSDFLSMSSALAALSCGMTGDITFNVNPGTYTEAVNIGGYSNPNNYKLTIQANPNATGTVEFTNDYSSTPYNIQLSGVNNVTLRGLKLTATGSTSGRLLRYAGANTDILVENCEMIRNTSTSTYGVYYASSTTTDYLAGELRNNIIDAGYYSVYLNLNGALNYKLINNTIKSTYYGVYAYRRSNGNTVTIDSNFIEVPVSGASGYGIYVYSNSSYPTGRALIRSNRVLANYYGLTLGYTRASSMAPSEIINNIITTFDASNTSTMRGLYLYVVENVNVYHNTISVQGGSATSGRAVFINGLTNTEVGINFANNIAVNNGPGQVIGLQSLTKPVFTTFDNNTYYGNGTTLFYAGTNKATLSDYQATFTTGFESNSTFGDPEFYGGNDFNVQGLSVSNNGIPVGVVNDYDGNIRSTVAPDRGAYEFTYYSCKRPAAATVTGRGISSLDVAWTSLNSSKLGTAFRYRKQGVTAWTRQVVFGSASTARIAGLSANSTYEIYLYELCSATDSSQLTASAITGTTLCSYSTVLPVSQNFEGTTPISGCWVAFPSTATNGWSVQGPSTTAGPTVASEGTKYAYLNPVSPTASGPYSLEFQGRAFPADAKQINFDYWVGNGWNVKPMSGTLENGTTSANACGPFYTYYQDARFQYIIRASEMHQLYGANAGDISSLSFDLRGLPQFTMAGFTIKIGTASINAFPSTGAVVLTGATNVVYSQGTTPLNLTTTGLVTFPFTSTYSWDGVSDLLIDVCFDNPGSGQPGYISPGYGNNGIVRYSNMHFNSTLRQNADNNTGCSFPASQSRSVLNIRPNMQFGFTPGVA
ncbi:MAG: hypothetical protein NWQ77_02620, partial [Schleiferiaceae bacterium]|nr:hypothetical protein [Schleiferiaceae bacterium]